MKFWSVLHTTIVARLLIGLSFIICHLSFSPAGAQTWTDVTKHFIMNPAFDTKDGWTWETSSGTAGIGSGNMRFYNGTFDFHQTLSGLPAGRYRLSVQSFYRDGDSESAWNKHQSGTESLDAWFYAGDNAKPVVSIFSQSLSYNAAGRSWSPDGIHYYPEGRDAAGLAFEDGLYWNTMEFEAEGTIDIGIRCNEQTQGNYSVADNFKLEYKGTLSVASAETIVINEIMAANVGDFLSPAINFDGWVELYNPTNEEVRVGGLYVSNDANDLKRWQLPFSIGTIPAKSFKVIWFGSDEIRLDQAPFKLDCDGGTIYFSDEEGNVISQDFPVAMSHTAWARKTDDSGTWARTDTPTPGATNATAKFADQRLAAPVVSENSRLFTGTLQVTVDIPEGATLMYTTDGSLPTAPQETGATGEGSSMQSTDGRFTVSTTTGYTFRLFQDGYLSSAPVTRSYIQTDDEYTFPVISIVGDTRFFTDPKIGIDCNGDGTNGKTGNGQNVPRNYNMPWNRPVNFSYIMPDGETYNQDVNISISGGWTRSKSPRSMKLKSSKVFDGQNRFDYAFFPQKPYIRSKTLLVRNGGNDVDINHARFIDPALQTIIQRSDLNIDQQSYVPIIEYVNGKCRGVLNLREPNNDKFVYANWGFDDDEIDMFENSKFTNGNDSVFNRICELSEDINDEGAYDEMKTLLDIDEFINYIAVELYLGNDDWPDNNIKGYRSQDDGRYRFVLFDLDFSFGLRQSTPVRNTFTRLVNSYSSKLPCKIFLNLLQHSVFRRQFIDSFCLIGGSVFDEQRVEAIVDELADRLHPMLTMVNDGYTPDRAANSIKTRLQGRLEQLADCMQQFQLLELDNAQQQTVTLNADTDGACLFVNGVNVPYADFNGILFAPVRVEAKAPAGYKFAGWKNGSGKTVCSNATYDLPDDAAVSLTATFKKLSADELTAQGMVPLRINEVSAANSIYVNDYFKRNDWFELYNTTDTDLDLTGLYVSDDPSNPQKYQITAQGGFAALTPAALTLPAGGHRIIWADGLTPMTQLHASFKLGNSNEKTVIVSSSDEFERNNAGYFAKHPEMKSFTDELTYYAHRGVQTVGRYPDGSNTVYVMNRPSIDRPNVITSADLTLEEYAPTLDIATLSSPFTLQPSPDATHLSPIQGYYNLSGTLVSRHAASLSEGIYIVRYSNGRCRKIVIK